MTGIIGPAAQMGGIILFAALALAGLTIYVFGNFPETPWWIWPAGALVVGCVLTTGLVALRAYWAWAMKRSAREALSAAEPGETLREPPRFAFYGYSS